MRKRLLWLSLLVALPAAAQQGHDHHMANYPPAAAESADAGYARFSNGMDVGMRRMMDDMHAPGYGGDPDVDFLAMMIPHHEGAVEMARLVLVHGHDPATRRLAEDIIASQTVEIEGMKRRLAALRSRQDPASEYPALGGTRGPVRR